MKWNQCIYCGKFISLKSMDNRELTGFAFTPDTHFTNEKIEWFHFSCVKKEAKKRIKIIMSLP